MDNTAQNKAIAEYCEKVRPSPYEPKWRWKCATGDYVPNLFTSDLNDMHEAEKVLDQSQQLNYQIKLGGHPADNDYWLGYHSTAAQRAEAFLKTLKLWT